MSDLTAFVSARLDEDEATAKAVKDGSAPWDGQWQARDRLALETYNGWVIAVSPGLRLDLDPAAREFAPGVVEHIARHDPARVLREVAAVRALVEAYRASVRSVGEGLSRTLRELVMWRAAVYSDHPDYREEWEPLSA